MELRLNRSRVLIALAGVAVAFALIGIAVAPRSKGQEVEQQPAAGPGTCADLARGVDPSKVPVDSGYDPEKDVVSAHYGGRTYTMRPNDPVCRALRPARAVIDDTMESHRQNMAQACRAMRDIVATKRASVRGRAVDHEAARRFIAKRCGSAES